MTTLDSKPTPGTPPAALSALVPALAALALLIPGCGPLELHAIPASDATDSVSGSDSPSTGTDVNVADDASESLDLKGVTTSVTAQVETQAVPHAGDAADDPCVWVHPTDPSQSTIVGTDKLGGIAVYDLSGAQLQYRADGNINNIDIRYGFSLGAAKVDLIGGTNRTHRTLTFWKVNADRSLSSAGAFSPGAAIADPYGFTLYKNAAGKFFAFVVDKDSGIVEQYELSGTTGVVTGTKVRTFDVGGQTEGLVADDVLGHFYAAEERVAIWRYGAEPNVGAVRTRVVAVGSNVAADLEGLALYYRPDGTGYLIASSQGNNTYALFDRKPPNAYLSSFRISSGAIDGTNDTDGIDVTNVNLGPAFPEGAFIAQDGSNDSGNQNFKLVSWGSIARSFRSPLAVDTSWDPRSSPGNAPADGPGPAPVPSPEQTTPIPSASQWRYLDNGQQAPSGWTTVSFDDSGWKLGTAELGYGDGDEGTVVSFGPSTSQRYITTYFRKGFEIADASAVTQLDLKLKRDDGAVVYLNGVEVFRTNMPSGTITSTTPASSVIEESTYHETALSRSALRTGTNVLAIEVHQSSGASTDLSMDAILTAR